MSPCEKLSQLLALSILTHKDRASLSLSSVLRGGDRTAVALSRHVDRSAPPGSFRQITGPHPEPRIQEVRGRGQELTLFTSLQVRRMTLTRGPQSQCQLGKEKLLPSQRGALLLLLRAQTTGQLSMVLHPQRMALPGARSSARRRLPHC